MAVLVYRNQVRAMYQLDFKSASKHIKSVDTKLEHILRGIWNQAPKEKQKDLCFYLAQYPYRSYLVKNGKPLDPAGHALSRDLIVAGGMPCGLILTNLVEIIDEIVRAEAVLEMPQSLLAQRQLIGVFEFIDEHLGVSGRPVPDWTISSGARSIRFLEFPTQKVQWDRLRSKYRHLPTYEKKFSRSLGEMDLVDLLTEGEDFCQKWLTDILYFAPAWFYEAEDQTADPKRNYPAAELFSYFKNLGWESLARVRDRQNKLEDAINEWGGDASAAKCKAAYLFVRYSMDVLTQRRPCFAPLYGRCETGPFDILVEKLLGIARLNGQILAPSYLRTGEAGFLSLSQLASSAFLKNPEDNLEDIIRIVVRAWKACVSRGISVPGLSNLDYLLSRMAFRVKSGRERSEGRHGSVSTFRVKLLSLDDRRGYMRKAIAIEDFYAPHFLNASFPPSDSRFFRVCIKLDLRGD
jgi:hypothetical protein